MEVYKRPGSHTDGPCNLFIGVIASYRQTRGEWLHHPWQPKGLAFLGQLNYSRSELILHLRVECFVVDSRSKERLFRCSGKKKVWTFFGPSTQPVSCPFFALSSPSYCNTFPPLAAATWGWMGRWPSGALRGRVQREAKRGEARGGTSSCGVWGGGGGGGCKEDLIGSLSRLTRRCFCRDSLKQGGHFGHFPDLDVHLGVFLLQNACTLDMFR